jgi:hypothetical protein
MLDIPITVLLVTLFVLGLFGLVQWVLSLLPRWNSAKWQPPVGKWWLVLLGIVYWLNNLSELLNSGSPSEWTKHEYFNVFYLCASSYLIVFVWKSTTKPAEESIQHDVSKDG